MFVFVNIGRRNKYKKKMCQPIGDLKSGSDSRFSCKITHFLNGSLMYGFFQTRFKKWRKRGLAMQEKKQTNKQTWLQCY